MTGAEKTLKWYKEFVKTNGVYPLIKEVESQLEMAVEEEQVNKNEFISLVSESKLATIEDARIELDRQDKEAGYPEQDDFADGYDAGFISAVKWIRENYSR